MTEADIFQSIVDRADAMQKEGFIVVGLDLHALEAILKLVDIGGITAVGAG